MSRWTPTPKADAKQSLVLPLNGTYVRWQMDGEPDAKGWLPLVRKVNGRVHAGAIGIEAAIRAGYKPPKN